MSVLHLPVKRGWKLAFITLIFLAACDRGALSKRNIEQALNASLGKDGGTCWNIKDSAVAQFPLRVAIDPSSEPNPILAGLQAAELIEVEQIEVNTNPYGFFSQQALLIDLTKAGKAAGAWNPQHGFCVGKPEVTEVLKWTGPAQQATMQMAEVDYRWRMVDQPAWVDKIVFQDVKGMVEPEQTFAILRKTSNGWEVLE